jgi:hypothetical protein
MSHTVTHNEELNLIETKAHGKLIPNEAKEIIAEIIQMSVEKNCFLCLSDYRESTMKLSTLEILDIPKIIADLSAQRGIHPTRFKRAIVVARDAGDFHFYETVTLNNMQNVRLFQDIDEAKQWLFEK